MHFLVNCLDKKKIRLRPQSKLSIGRKGCHVNLSDRSVSKIHCHLEIGPFDKNPSCITLTDVSTLGTYLSHSGNDDYVQVKNIVLSDGVFLKFGKYQVPFKYCYQPCKVYYSGRSQERDEFLQLCKKNELVHVKNARMFSFFNDHQVDANYMILQNTQISLNKIHALIHQVSIVSIEWLRALDSSSDFDFMMPQVLPFLPSAPVLDAYPDLDKSIWKLNPQRQSVFKDLQFVLLNSAMDLSFIIRATGGNVIVFENSQDTPISSLKDHLKTLENPHVLDYTDHLLNSDFRDRFRAALGEWGYRLLSTEDIAYAILFANAYPYCLPKTQSPSVEVDLFKTYQDGPHAASVLQEPKSLNRGLKETSKTIPAATVFDSTTSKSIADSKPAERTKSTTLKSSLLLSASTSNRASTPPTKRKLIDPFDILWDQADHPPKPKDVAASSAPIHELPPMISMPESQPRLAFADFFDSLLDNHDGIKSQAVEPVTISKNPSFVSLETQPNSFIEIKPIGAMKGEVVSLASRLGKLRETPAKISEAKMEEDRIVVPATPVSEAPPVVELTKMTPIPLKLPLPQEKPSKTRREDVDHLIQEAIEIEKRVLEETQVLPPEYPRPRIEYIDIKYPNGYGPSLTENHPQNGSFENQKRFKKSKVIYSQERLALEEHRSRNTRFSSDDE